MLRIRDGFHEYQIEKELTKLIDKIASLPGYKKWVFDSLFQEKKEQESFYKDLEESSLAKSALLYIFLNKRGSSYFGFDDLLPEAFKNLSFRKQSKFLAYYDAFQSYAIEYGFLEKYEATRATLEVKGSALFKLLGYGIGLFLIFLCVPSPMALIFAALFVHTGNIASNSSVKIQNDLIIQQLNQKKIEEVQHRAKQALIDVGWLEGEKSDSVEIEES